jgi:hypothetical protein
VAKLQLPNVESVFLGRANETSPCPRAINRLAADGSYRPASVGSSAGAFRYTDGSYSAEGVTAGCGNGDYCPQLPVSRSQMAVFLVKMFGLQLYGP